MQYGELISRSLSLVWRFKYLWLLAILGGADIGTGGFSGNFNNPGTLFGGSSPNNGGRGAPAVGDVGPQVSQFLNDWGWLIVLAAVALVVLALAWFVLSSITIGALVRASAEHDAERPFGLGMAWRTGLGTFWSIVGLRLLGLLWGLIVLAVFGTLFVLGLVTYLNGTTGGLAAVIAIGGVIGLLVIVVSILLGLAFTLATRAVVLEQRGPLSALGRGFGLVRARLGRVLLVWLLQIGLALAAGIAVAIVLIPVLLLAAGIVGVAAFTGGPGAAFAVGVPVGLVGLAVLIVVGGLAGAYLSTYWTLAFRRMELDAPKPVAWPPAAYPPQQPAG
ncbi:MAG TPA: hypothetical protein VIC57_00900 [Candidatus Dormibacteraeota bacterium]